MTEDLSNIVKIIHSTKMHIGVRIHPVPIQMGFGIHFKRRNTLSLIDLVVDDSLQVTTPRFVDC